MGRRIRWLGVIMVVCLGLVVAQLVNIQLVKAKQLQTSPFNPRVASQKYVNPRGSIYAADGTVLAKSVKTPAGSDTTGYSYQYVRQYPQGPLYAGITGYDSALYYGTAGIEQQYDSYLGPHQQPPQTLSQLIFRQQQPLTTDSVTLTVQPSLQNAAEQALTTLPPGANKDGAVVVLQPSTGNVLAMVSNPTFDPNTLASTSLQAEQLAYLSYTQKDHEGFFPLRPIANRETFPPGSTMKVVTSTAAYNLKPSLAGFNFPVAQCVKFSDSNVQLCDQSGPCGGTMTQMLPFSCDPGYAEPGVPP
jgi:penicillin-binding protein A